MSEVKVNKISPRTNCGTVTLGDSGDTFTIPSGATITNSGTASGFGATGEISWDTTVKTNGTFTATAGVGYFCNTTAGTITVNLPAGTAGDSVAMVDYAGTWDTYKVTVAPNGSEKIGGVAEDATLNTERQSVTFVYIDGTEGWVNVLDSTSGVTGQPPYPTATVSGACNTLVTCGDYKIATFKGPGTFCVSSVSGTPANDVADYLVVAGGASGGIRHPGNANGGGGAGGLRYSFATYTSPTCAPSHPIGAPTGVTLSVQGYPITVGGGGPGGAGSPTASRGIAGSPSTGLGIVSTTGGGGGAGSNNPTTGPGGDGGSGGGGGGGSPTGVPGGSGNTPPVSPSQGNDGGDAGPASPDASAAGGGGAIAVGGNGTPTANGAGGAGAGFPSAFGTAAGQPCGAYRYFAGGGGSGDSSTPAPKGDGGVGGGGAGGQGPSTVATAGTANTGGGGCGGASTTPACGAAGNGGSGVVIIRYRFQ